jgi:D-cysteine desulfhydrase
VTKELAFPPRVELARLPTPLQPLPRTSEALGVEVLIKRDDLTGAELSGNKVRKLEYLMADAQAAGADTVVTCGGEQSNHCRATALAATRLGLKSVLLLRTDDPANPPPTQGNILLDRLAGAEIVWISRPEYARRTEIFERETARLRGEGRAPYVIPEGGSNATGSWGYVGAARELRDDLAGLPAKPTTLIYACGSGGTGAGLILGAKLFDLDVRIAGINVCDDRDYFVKTMMRICDDFEMRYQTGAVVREDDIDIIEGYVGRGYAKSRPEELENLRDLARRESIIVDPVYSGKAYHGMVSELAANPGCFGERVVFLHTGGIFGLFPAAELLAPLL